MWSLPIHVLQVPGHVLPPVKLGDSDLTQHQQAMARLLCASYGHAEQGQEPARAVVRVVKVIRLRCIRCRVWHCPGVAQEADVQPRLGNEGLCSVSICDPFLQSLENRMGTSFWTVVHHQHLERMQLFHSWKNELGKTRDILVELFPRDHEP